MERDASRKQAETTQKYFPPMISAPEDKGGIPTTEHPPWTHVGPSTMAGKEVPPGSEQRAGAALGRMDGAVPHRPSKEGLPESSPQLSGKGEENEVLKVLSLKVKGDQAGSFSSFSLTCISSPTLPSVSKCLKTVQLDPWQVTQRV